MLEKTFCTLFNSEGKCILCRFPYNLSNDEYNSYCYLNYENYLPYCDKAFTLPEIYYCWQCTGYKIFNGRSCVDCDKSICILNLNLYFSLESSGLISRFNKINTKIKFGSSFISCNIEGCLICNLSNPNLCLQCIDNNMISMKEDSLVAYLAKSSKCICSPGSFLDKNGLKCVSCKTVFGQFCKFCNKSKCLECVLPYCSIDHSTGRCFCSNSLLRSCIYFNIDEIGLYYNQNCYCYNSLGECVLSCQHAYSQGVIACNKYFGYYTESSALLAFKSNNLSESSLGHNNTNNSLNYDYTDIIYNNTCINNNCSICNSFNDCLVDSNNSIQICPNNNEYVIGINGICINCMKMDKEINDSIWNQWIIQGNINSYIEFLNRNKTNCLNGELVIGSVCSKYYNKNCLMCDYKQGCIKCEEGYFLNDGQININYDYITFPYLKQNISNNSISSINKDDGNFGKCLPCSYIDKYCAICDESRCLICKEGYVLNYMNTCSVLLINQYFMSNNATRILDNPENCQDPNCIICPTIDRCLKCNQISILTITNTCEVIDCNIPNCKYCLISNKCLQCEENYFPVLYINAGEVYSGCQEAERFIFTAVVVIIGLILLIILCNCGCFGARKFYCFKEIIPFMYFYIYRYFLPKKESFSKLKRQINSKGDMNIKIKMIEETRDSPLNYYYDKNPTIKVNALEINKNKNVNETQVNLINKDEVAETNIELNSRNKKEILLNFSEYEVLIKEDY